MRHLHEYRDPGAVARLADAIRRTATRRWRVMEVCGGQTWAILRHGLDELLEGAVELLHGPGCPVCVTDVATIDGAIAVAGVPGTILASFGDMLRVPGSAGDLLGARAAGGDVRVVYSPLDGLDLARRHPGREVVFLAVGFETTAPAVAMAVRLAERDGIGNFSLLVSHRLVPPAIDAVMGAPGNRVEAFLAAGHVCTITGTAAYPPLARRHRVPIVVSGFEPVDLLEGVRRAVVQLEAGRHETENAYARVVRDAGNTAARALLDEVFEVCDRTWRGIGAIPGSGWRLSGRYAAFDAERRFGAPVAPAPESMECRAGEVLTGAIKPPECAAFGVTCTPRTPAGAPMVSAEGVCAAYWHAGRRAAAGGGR